MNTLNDLTAEARSLGNAIWLTPAEQEVSRQMHICNGCRYCEGFCAVFPAMTRRLAFEKADVHYLANLCHNCGACLHACQYAPPHDFAINVPQAMAKVRAQTYADFAWPAGLGRLYKRNGLLIAVLLFVALATFLALAAASKGSLFAVAGPGTGFYDVFPHGQLVGMFAPIFAWVVLALGMGVRRFWSQAKTVTTDAPLDTASAAEATQNILQLTYLDGGHGEGCNNADDTYTLARRRFHHLTFYGFVLCFAATSVATFYHYLLGWAAPYDLPSLPKVLGLLGGLSMVAGTVGLGWLNSRRHPEHGDPAQKPMDRGFIALLFLTASTGLVLWLTRGGSAQTLWLCIHLAAVMALFLTMPYGKFAHGVYRSAALFRYAIEKRQPNTVGLSDS